AIVSAKKIHIIGLGNDGLAAATQHARELIEQAQVIVGAEPLLAKLPKSSAERIALGSNLDDAVAKLGKSGDKSTVILASGDPLFYGVARYLCDKLGKDRFEVVPHVSSMQLAFARVKESWEEAYLTNLATHPLENMLDRIRIAEVVGLFTSEQESPTRIA